MLSSSIKHALTNFEPEGRFGDLNIGVSTLEDIAFIEVPGEVGSRWRERGLVRGRGCKVASPEVKLYGIDLDASLDVNLAFLQVSRESGHSVVVYASRNISEALRLTEMLFTSGHNVHLVYDKRYAPSGTVWLQQK